jgi:hypothetical protein
VARSPALAALIAVAIWLGAQAAEAAPPPTLTDEVWDGFYYYPGGPGCRDNPGGGATFLFDNYVSTLGNGQYIGPAAEKLEFTFGPAGDFNEHEILAAQGEFTVDSSIGQVSGTVVLGAPYPPIGSNDGAFDCSLDGVGYVNSGLRYSATIVTADGVFADRGRSVFSFGQRSPGQPVYLLNQGFDSDLSAPEQKESVLFGRNTPGGSFSAMSANTKRASPFTLFAPATVRKLYAYIDGKGATSGSQTIRAVLYRNAGGLPAAYVTRSFEFTVPAGMSARWVPLYLAPPAQLGPGVYWIGLQSSTTNGVARFAWNSKPNARRFNVDSFANGASDPFGSALADDQQLSIFAAGSY